MHSFKKVKEQNLFKTFPEIQYIRALPSPSENRWLELQYEQYRYTLESELLMLVNSLVGEYERLVEQGGILDSLAIKDLIHHLRNVRSLSYVSEKEKKDTINKIGDVLIRSCANKAYKENLNAYEIILLFSIENLKECKDNKKIKNGIKHLVEKYFKDASFYRKKWEELRSEREGEEKMTLEEAEDYISKIRDANKIYISKLDLDESKKKKLEDMFEKIDLLSIQDEVVI